jgi:large conductance mechanosensitive channel
MWKEFKEFIMRGNVIDLAIGIVIGAAFGKIVTSFLNDILMPPIGLLLGRVDFTNLYISLTGQHFETLQAARDAGAVTINYGVFLSAVLDFLIVGFVIFLVIRQMNRMARAKKEEAPATKECGYCLSSVPEKATRCSHCTSDLKAANV